MGNGNVTINRLIEKYMVYLNIDDPVMKILNRSKFDPLITKPREDLFFIECVLACYTETGVTFEDFVFVENIRSIKRRIEAYDKKTDERVNFFYNTEITKIIEILTKPIDYYFCVKYTEKELEVLEPDPNINSPTIAKYMFVDRQPINIYRIETRSVNAWKRFLKIN